MTITTANNLRVVSSVLREGAIDNLNRLGTPSARKVSATTNIDRLGGSGILRHSLSLTRGVDPLLEESMRKQVSNLEKTNTITSYLQSMQSVISGGDNSQESLLVSSINEFFSQVNLLQSDNISIPMKKTLVDKATNLAQRVTDINAKGVDLQLQADNQMKESITGVNSTIKSLFDLNRKIRITPMPIKLHDLRDNLVNEIAKYMDVKATFETNGSVLLQSKSSGKMLVSGDQYAQFSYPGIQLKSKLQYGLDLPPMTINHFNEDGSKTHQPMIFMGGSNDKTLEFSGGEWGAIVELRKDILPEIINAAKCVGKNITKSINDVYNNGSTFPPKARFESSMDVYGAQTFDWKPFTIYAIDKNGDQINQEKRLFNPIIIDMSKVAASKGEEVATLADMVKEINLALDTGPSSNRAAIGSIFDGNQNQIGGEYLINNIQLKSNSAHLEANKNFSFEIELEGNSHFGSEIQIMSVRASDVGGANVVDPNIIQLPQDFRLEKGENTKRTQSINVPWNNMNNNQKEITIEICVTGDNGQKQQGFITYHFNPDNININDRITIDPVTANHRGDFIDPAMANNFNSVARAMLVDENGIEIDANNSPNSRGKLVIQTTDNEYCLGFEGLAQIFEFNNMFEFDEDSGEMSVNSRIASDVDELALGKIVKGDGDDIVHTIGERAELTLNFDFNGGALAAGDAITIDGQQFNFVNHLVLPENPNDVLIADGIMALEKKINNHPIIGRNVIATFNRDDNALVIEARNAGINGNLIPVSTNLVHGGTTVDLGLGAGAIAVNAGNLQGGTDKQEISKVYKYNIKSRSSEIIEELNNLQHHAVSMQGNGFIPSTEISISNLATVFTGVLSDTLNVSETESNIASNVLERTQSLIQDKFGINRNEEYIKAVEDGRLLQSLAHLLSIINNIDAKVQDIIFG